MRDQTLTCTLTQVGLPQMGIKPTHSRDITSEEFIQLCVVLLSMVDPVSYIMVEPMDRKVAVLVVKLLCSRLHLRVTCHACLATTHLFTHCVFHCWAALVRSQASPT
eukprot:3729405-Amphidinium_carterae.1